MENKTRISLNTSALGNKIAAFHHILRLSEAMGSGFVQYVPLVLPVLKDHINHFSKSIRKSSLKTFHHIMAAQGEPENLKFFKEVYGLLGLNIIMANKKEDVKEMKLLFKEMFHCMRVISQNESPEFQRFFESADQMNSFGQLMAQCLQTVATNKEHQLAVIEEKHRNVQIDEEDEGEIKQELYKITGAATYINECCDIIMQTYKGDSADMIDNAVRFYFGKVLQDYKTVSERELQDATFFFMEYIEHCRNSDKMMIYELCSQFAEITLWT